MCVGYVIVVPELILIGLMIGGAVLILSWIASCCQDKPEPPHDPRDGVLTPCHRCRHLNPTHARYCARCGCAQQ